MKHVLAVFFSLLVVQCGTPLKTKQLNFARGVALDLPQLPAFEQAIAATHQLEVQNRGNTYKFPAQVEMEKDRLVIVGLTPVGSRAFSLVYTGDSLTYEAIPFFNLPLKPDTFLLAYLLSVLPGTTLENYLATQGLALKKSGENWEIQAGNQRVVRYFGEPQTSPKKQITLQHLQEGYWLKVKTLQWETFED